VTFAAVAQVSPAGQGGCRAVPPGCSRGPGSAAARAALPSAAPGRLPLPQTLPQSHGDAHGGVGETRTRLHVFLGVPPLEASGAAACRRGKSCLAESLCQSRGRAGTPRRAPRQWGPRAGRCRCLGGPRGCSMAWRGLAGGCGGCPGPAPGTVPQRSLAALWQQHGRLLTWRKKQTQNHVAYRPAPSLPCGRTGYTSACQSGQRPTHTVMALVWFGFFLNSSLTLAIKCTLYT